MLSRLISLLSLNFVSLVDNGPATLQELLALQNLRESPAGARQVDAIVGLRAGPVYSRIAGDHGLAFARGHRIELDLDEERFAGGGVYLFAGLLERCTEVESARNSDNIQTNTVLPEIPRRLLESWSAMRSPRASRSATGDFEYIVGASSATAGDVYAVA
jgi:hypothetical protein